MRKNIFIPKIENLLRRYFLLFSTVAALCLFLKPSLASLLEITVVFFAALVIVLLDQVKPSLVFQRHTRICILLLALSIAIMGYHIFITTWTPSSKVGALAGALHLSKPILLAIVGLTGCTVGFYSIYTLLCWIAANLKQNWYFPISAMAFFCMTGLPLGYSAALLSASMIAASQLSSIWGIVKKLHIGYQLTAIFTSIGICVFYFNRHAVASKLQNLQAVKSLPDPIIELAEMVFAAAAFFFLYICVLFLWKKMVRILAGMDLFKDVTTWEKIIYAGLLLASIFFITIVFSKSQAFYRTEYKYDIIYTSDSPDLVKRNAYMLLTHTENDIRQPLFAVFAAPFVSVPYLLGKLSNASASVQAMLMNYVQILMLFAANYMLAKIMGLTAVKRGCFMLLTCCTYTYLLFILMMEQYIVAYFWLIFCLYLICKKEHPDHIALWGAGGTLLTSMALLPFMTDRSPFRDFRKWFADIVKCGLEFAAVLLVCCRFDVIISLISRIKFLSKYTGKNLSLLNKVLQYLAFIRNCFFAPYAGVVSSGDHLSWRLLPITKISRIGIAIFLLAVLGFILNRNKKISRLAAWWICFSVIMLICLGWGTNGNGLNLYSLYFGWAFFVLLFQFAEIIENRLNIKFLIPAITLGGVLVLSAVNIPAIMEMVSFAITNYPT